MQAPTLKSMSVSQVLELRTKSQCYQAEGRKPSDNKEKTVAIGEAFDFADEQGLSWPIGMELFKIASVGGEQRLLGGFHRAIGLNSSSYAKAHKFDVVDYGEIDIATAIQMAGADNLHLGLAESPFQRTLRVQAIMANNGDLEESLKLLNLTKKSFDTYVSTLKGMNTQARKALAGGKVSDAQAKAISALAKHDPCFDVKSAIADPSESVSLASKLKAGKVASKEEDPQASKPDIKNLVQPEKEDPQASSKKEDPQASSKKESPQASKEEDPQASKPEKKETVADYTSRKVSELYSAFQCIKDTRDKVILARALDSLVNDMSEELPPSWNA